MTVKTSPLSLASALLLSACFTPTGSGDPSGAATDTDATGGPTATTTTTGVTTEPPTGTTDEATTTGATLTTESPTSSSGTTTDDPCPVSECECELGTDCLPPLVCHQGQCVECIDDTTCDGRVCDPVDHVCRGCREHAECPEMACELDDGLCFPAQATAHAWVDPNAACSDQPCSIEEPCCSIQEALKLKIDQADHLVFHLGPGSYPSGINVSQSGRRIALLGDPQTSFTAELDAGSMFQLGIDGQDLPIDTELYVARVAIEGGQGAAAFRCNAAADLWLDDVRVFGFTGRVVSVSDCDVVLRRTNLRLNTYGIGADKGAVVTLENVMLAHLNMGAALEIGAGTQVQMLYTSVADITQHPTGLLACGDSTATIVARNSLLVSAQPAGISSCAASSLDIGDSVVSDVSLATGRNTLVYDPLEIPDLFADWQAGNLHLDPPPPFEQAVWRTGDPRTDIDGDLRPAGGESPDIVGADRPSD